MSLPLKNKLVLVTGVSRGIGAAIARRLAVDGGAILVHYHSSRKGAEAVVREIQQAGGDAEAITADLSQREGPLSLLAGIDGVFGGRLEVLVNNVQPAVIQPEPIPTSGPTFQAMQKYTSVGRFGKPEEIAEAVAFLANPKAGFINGESLTVDNGWSA